MKVGDHRVVFPSNLTTPSVRRFEEIEGLRGWLSWTVVLWHVIQYTGLNGHYRVLGSTAGLAHLAVELFIIVSGFVVTHRLVTRDEPYPRYLARRAFRLFPLYLVMAVIGAVSTGLAAQAVTHVPWASDPAFTYRDTLLATYASQQLYFPIHAVLHALLVQGAVPDSVLPFSSAVFLGPAWSLSLEWQFYLIAPLVVGGLRRPRRAAVMLSLLVAACFAQRAGMFGSFRLMSSFPAAALLFLTGIVSRLGLERLGAAIGSPTLVALAGLALAILLPEFVSIGLWIAFFAFLATQDRPRMGLDALVAPVWAALFGSRTARWFGARSYAVYVAHWPLLQMILFALRDHLSANVAVSAAMLTSLLVPATLIVAEVLHQMVEQPMVKLGARIVGKRRGGAVAALKGRADGSAIA